jgi:hypothetical protein
MNQDGDRTMIKGKIEWEHDPEEGLTLHIKPGLDGLFNGETCRHMRAARREMLLTLRGLIDIAVTRMEEKENKAQKRQGKIEVE